MNDKMNGLPLDLSEFEKRIGYVFKNKQLLETALTHSSYSNELRVKHIDCEYNERLEFLGDSVLSIVVSEYLYSTYAGEHAEGDLTRMRADVVCELALVRYALKIGLGQFLRLGHGEEKNRGRERKSIIADAFEATLAAIYLDAGKSGKETVAKYLLPFIKEELKDITGGTDIAQDYKTHLQQLVQQSEGEKLEYLTVGESGPDHKKVFDVVAKLNSNIIGRGSGATKREAEQNAAKQALELFGEL
jgi:ribonuclease-3